MSPFKDIIDAHEVADDATRKKMGTVAMAGHDDHFVELYHLSIIAANAYFFMLFARFEHRVTELAMIRVEAGRQATIASDRRVWAVLDVKKMDFLRRLALLTDKGSSDYATVKELYEDRNAIAHGSLVETKPNVKVVATILSGVLSRLEGTP
ncbi:hypothetical protein CHU95_16070 [Niveispirillum lacus]|uniref:RiboL-PSP-HEPN domain-containing protein n=1 Tax=Niveispirillum lacus TaxID=1981099 RepID=A0A255YV67_9PROT|nr:hypothetical protein [Niveispirillum lacus]OYQ32320.1 hypothetical protein CHU95_16070 [Niveispirillum lacus]